MNPDVAISAVSGLVVGCVAGALWVKVRSHASAQAEREQAEKARHELDREFAAHKAATETRLQNMRELLGEKEEELAKLLTVNDRLSHASAKLQASEQAIADKIAEIEKLKSEYERARLNWEQASEKLAAERANNRSLQEKLDVQKSEMEALGKKFNTEFENIANKILETKTEKFTELNKSNLTAILEPLGKNIADFKTKVEEVYDKEAKERFSLGEKVKELSVLNQVISEEARNLTKALKGEAKTQGLWGEMILESILERSGLVKGREYFMEHELKDGDGNALRTDSEGKKMRPDAVINYPDNRRVIIDSKVSLNAFTRMVASDDAAEQKNELLAHISAVKNHIIALSAKGYDDYDKSLDFVMMFIPSEPAYNAALQGDPELWNFAYEKRILLLSPTNLITSLKLIVDLWKREYQNRNALEIADRGRKLYDKFVGFVENLNQIGTHLSRAQDKYDEAYKQLSTGNDNLVLQATKLKELGLKTKKSLPDDLVNNSLVELPPSNGEESNLIEGE